MAFNQIVMSITLTQKVAAADLPAESIAADYVEQGRYVDCFAVSMTDRIEFPQYLEAFYTSKVFKLERLILAAFVRRPSTDQQACQLAAGELQQFAAWSQEARTENQIIMCDYQQLTRSWLMAKSEAGITTLFFGTIIVPKGKAAAEGKQMGLLFRVTLWAHLLYSKILLRSAIANLRRRNE